MYAIKDLHSLKPTDPDQSLPLLRDPVSNATVSFLHGAVPHMCLETDYSLSWLKINCIFFSSEFPPVRGKSLLLALKKCLTEFKTTNIFHFYFSHLEKHKVKKKW